MADQLSLIFAEQEEWRICVDWPNYEVSSLGRVRRATDHRVWNGGPNSKIMIPAGTLLSPTQHPTRKWMRIMVGGKTTAVHKLVCIAFHGPRPSPKHEVAHWDGDPTNNRSGNLRWATHAENMDDLARHGRKKGERSATAKLTELDVRKIRQRLAAGEHYAAIAADYPVDPTTILHIRSGRKWGWLE